MDGWMDGWIDGRNNGWMDGWMDGWIDGIFRIEAQCNNFCLTCSVSSCTDNKKKKNAIYRCSCMFAASLCYQAAR